MRALTVIVIQRLWQAGAGLVTLMLVARLLTPVEQGWYYSFLGIGALYTVFDLGLSIALTQTAAHLFADAAWSRDGGVSGGKAAVVHALVHRAIRSYLALAAGFALVIMSFGFVFFSMSEAPLDHWQPIWMVLISSLAVGLLMLPFLAIVEGSGNIVEVYFVRLIQGIFGAVATWILLIAGAGLWAVVAAPLAAAGTQPLWLLSRRPGLATLPFAKPPVAFSWRTEIWPLQWRLGISWLAGYLTTQIYTPLLFATHGPVIAGQMGLSLTAANMLGLVAFSAITRSVPAMGTAAAQSKWSDMDKLFFKGMRLSAAAYIFGALVVLIGLSLPVLSAFSGRFLPLWICATLFTAIFFNQLHGALAAHLRSYRREPLVWLAVGTSALTALGAAVVVSPYSAAGIVIVLVLVQALVLLPASLWLWQRFNRNWRGA